MRNYVIAAIIIIIIIGGIIWYKNKQVTVAPVDEGTPVTIPTADTGAPAMDATSTATSTD